MNGVWVSGVDIDGDFTQSVIGSPVGRDLTLNQYKFMRAQPTMYLGSDEVERRLACYVPAYNHDEIVRLLGDDRAIVLTGQPGSGRSTTAIAAMQDLRPGIPIRRFSLEQEGVEEIGHGGPHGYLVRAADGNLDRLGSCIDAVRKSGDYLAVIADHVLTELGAVSLPRVPVEPPPPLPVYRHWVSKHHRLPEWAAWERAGVLLRDARPADARRLADLVAHASERDGTREERQAQAAQAYLGWNEDLRDWFGKYRQPHDRALLIAAATLPSGASEGYVYAAASSLAKALRTDVNGGGLAWHPVTGLRTLLDASPDDRVITFYRADFPRAILRHALADYPLARAEILTWLSQLPTGAAGEYNRANEAAEIFADLAADLGEAEHITKAARRWGEQNPAELAFIALSRTSLHPRTGGRVRQTIYDWSRTTNIPQPLKLVIAQVCELIGQEYTSVALTRLKHLATRGNHEVLREVIATSMALADAGHRTAVTNAALQWCDPDASGERLSARERRRRRRAGALLFLGLASAVEPSGIPTVSVDTETIMVRFRPHPQAWRAVFEFLDWSATDYRDTVETTMHLWLDIALTHDSIRDQVCTMFITAASSTPSLAEAALSPLTDGTVARTVTAIVRRWAALDRTDLTRAAMEQKIIVGLSSFWWVRLLRILIWNLRVLLRPRTA